ncbi:MAG: hypothetical protein M9894_26455 [Planctomycetes bacterium]|nr:hypothetical protein [Planctomycetota bacterium]
MRLPAVTLTLAALALGGCASSEPTEDELPKVDEPAVVLPPGPRLKFDFELEWSDIDRERRTGARDPEQVARWVTERRNAVQQCLRNEPTQAVRQAIELLEEILSKVPDSSRDRYLLAQCMFFEASYWFRLADSYAWEMNRLELDRTAHQSDGGRALSDEEVAAKVAELRKVFDLLLVNLNRSAGRSLSLFASYRQQRADDKSVYDYLWKLHFYLQNYVEAQRWLDQVLHEMDLAGIPERDPLRQDYRELRKEILERVTEQRLGQFQPVKPFVRDRMRLSEAGTRPPGAPPR